ncbi:MAG: twin-arginine translocation signal domain-containing protein [Acidobacteriota bacterium]|jgi:hypothetical protein|nr:twin-arginine translocation signal domain-containing protein [Acidobacteriota bacterium]
MDSKEGKTRRGFIKEVSAGAVAGATLANLGCSTGAGGKGAVTLEILEPHGELAFPERKGLSAPRLGDLNGKKVAILAIGADSEAFFDTVKAMMKQRYPKVEFVHFVAGGPNSPDNSAEVAAACDAWIEGVKASETGSRHDTGARLEKRGCPGVAIVSDAVIRAKKLLADINGMPTCRVLAVPAVDFLVAKADLKLMKPVAEAAFEDIRKALTDPLTKEEREVEDFKYDYSPKKFTGADYAEANEKFQQYCADNQMTCGLPVVPPTREAVDRMLAGTSYPPDKEIGLLFPKQGRATVEKIAISAVMAGAKPEYLPVIIAMVEAIAKDFNQYHIVNEILPITFISGPIVEEIGLNNGVGYLAPGHRANATIGRALLMCMINIGWRRMDVYSSPGGLGQPVAYVNYVIPENQAVSPWESFAASNGFPSGESTVTICEGIFISRGPSETLSDAGFKERMEEMKGMFSHSAGVFGFFGMPRDASEMRHMIAIHPTFARQLANAGYTRESFVRWLHDQNTIDWDKMGEAERKAFRAMVAEGKVLGVKPEDCKPGLRREPFADPRDVAVIVAGTGAGGVIVFQTPVGSTAHAEDVETPRPFMHKVVRGATLTKAGR